MKINLKNNLELNYLLVFSIAICIFHLLILIKFVPYNITWGGRLKNDQEMYVFESISLLINGYFILVLLQIGNYISIIFNKLLISFSLWFLFITFTLNTLGNIVAVSNLEKTFAIITALNAFCIWRLIFKKQ